MTDELCDKCGIGFFLPSGRCDHCNCLQCLAHVRELLTPEEKATHAKWGREAAIKAKHPAADFAEKQADLIDSVRTTPRRDSELKPCPFCGQAVRLYQTKYGGVMTSFWCIACDNKDGCLGSPDYCADTEEEIVTMWNRRAVA